jgi:hypothetical protein
MALEWGKDARRTRVEQARAGQAPCAKKSDIPAGWPGQFGVDRDEQFI